MFLTDAPIVSRRQVGEGMWVIGLHAPEVAASVKSGQFVNIGLNPGPLLRRPFSVYRASDASIEVILKAVGTGTAQLISLREGDVVSCLGPLGRGFELRTGLRTAWIQDAAVGSFGIRATTSAVASSAASGIGNEYQPSASATSPILSVPRAARL